MARLTARQREFKQRDFHGDLTGMNAIFYGRVSIFTAEDQQARADYERSVYRQEQDNLDIAARRGIEVKESYSDEGISASRFTRKTRPGFFRMLDDIRSGRHDDVDILLTYELSRLARNVGVIADLWDLTREHCMVWFVGGHLRHTLNYQDRLATVVVSATDEASSEQTSERILQQKRYAVTSGKPPDKIAYGYKRNWDLLPSGKRVWVSDEPNVFNGDGTAVDDSPAAIVREIYERIAGGESLRSLGREFDERGIPTPRGGKEWRSVVIRQIAMNPTYAGMRRHHGEIQEGIETKWAPLVDEGLYWQVQRILSNPERVKWRPGSGRYLASHIARCGKCDHPLIAQYKNWRERKRLTYQCGYKGCTAIAGAEFEDLVERNVIELLADRDWAAALQASQDTPAAKEAETDRNRALAKLEEVRQAFEVGDIELPSFSRREKHLLAQIKDAERRMETSTTPTVLHGRIGPRIRTEWNDPDITPLEIKRQIIRTVCEIRVHPVGSGRWRGGLANRGIEWRWRLGTDTEWRMLWVPTERRDSTADLLTVLGERGEVLQKDLPELLDRPIQSAIRLVINLQERGWVDRQIGPHSPKGGRPTHVVTLTDAGQKALAEIRTTDQ